MFDEKSWNERLRARQEHERQKAAVEARQEKLALERPYWEMALLLAGLVPAGFVIAMLIVTRVLR